MSFISRLFNPKSKESKKTEELPEKVVPEPKEEKRLDPNLCKCVHCHQEFYKEDFLGLCTSRACENSDIIIQDIFSMKYLPDIGHKRLLLREETKMKIPALDREESKIVDLLTNDGKCCVCKSSVFFYACPHCRHPLPFITAAELEKVIAPAGIKASGKTTYMTVLIDYLLNHPIYNTRFELTTRFTQTRDYADYFENKYKILFSGKSLMMNEPTEVPKPYIIKTTSKNNDTREESSIHTLWYDFAGEALANFGAHDPILQYFRAVKGLFLFVDPKNIPNTVDELQLTPEDVPSLHRDGLVMTTIDQILNSSQHGVNELKNKFIAVILNKIDLVDDKENEFFPPDSAVWQPSPHHALGAFSLDDYNQVNQEVERYIRMNHSVLYNLLQPCFNEKRDNIGFFGVSTLGQEPVAQGMLDKKIKPRRIQDPFYWMLWKMNSIPAIGDEVAAGDYDVEPVAYDPELKVYDTEPTESDSEPIFNMGDDPDEEINII